MDGFASSKLIFPSAYAFWMCFSPRFIFFAEDFRSFLWVGQFRNPTNSIPHRTGRMLVFPFSFSFRWVARNSSILRKSSRSCFLSLPKISISSM